MFSLSGRRDYCRPSESASYSIIALNRSSKAHILYELATCIKGAIDADAFNLYIISESSEDFFKYAMPGDRQAEEEIP